MKPEELSALINTLSESKREQLQRAFTSLVMCYVNPKASAVLITRAPCTDDPEDGQMLWIHGVNANKEAVAEMMLNYLAHECAGELSTPDESMRH